MDAFILSLQLFAAISAGSQDSGVCSPLVLKPLVSTCDTRPTRTTLATVTLVSTTTVTVRLTIHSDTPRHGQPAVQSLVGLTTCASEAGLRPLLC